MPASPRDTRSQLGWLSVYFAVFAAAIWSVYIADVLPSWLVGAGEFVPSALAAVGLTLGFVRTLLRIRPLRLSLAGLTLNVLAATYIVVSVVVWLHG
jgi:hypothetical protein